MDLLYRSDLPMPKGLPKGLCLPDVPWSFSALAKFEDCALSYGAINVKKQYPVVQTWAMEQGNETHAALERYVQTGAPLPPGLKHIGKLIDEIAKRASRVVGEQQISFTNRFQICGTFDGDVSYRGKIDLLALYTDAIIVIDYKTSKEPREPFEQLEWMMLATLLQYPQYDIAHGIYLYTKHKPRRCSLTRDQMEPLIHGIIPRLERLADARRSNTYLPTPGYYCAWCPVKSCRFYKGK